MTHSRTSKSLLNMLLESVEKISLSKQILYGTFSGWIASYGLMKVGKTAALVIGGGIVLIEIASENGYVNINWNKINMRIEELAENRHQEDGEYWVDIVEQCIDINNERKKFEQKSVQRRTVDQDSIQSRRNNIVFLSSIFAGLLIGIGMS
uniref:FUN14 domain-containing protein n=1 Tax=Photinus pyralis TaxID=7054 RepID=A0A1Y1MLM7_PHOPY